jgi:iron complex transport system ATP-binding protein
MSVTILTADAIGYRVGDAELLAGVQMSAERGELVAIIGPNGAGKSTMLRLLGGDLAPSAGTVSIGDTRLGDIPAADLSLYRAVMGQDTPGDIPFPVRAVVAFGRYPHRRDPENTRERDAEAIEEAMERTDTVHLSERIYATLSGGERTRVDLARVFAQDAPIMLLDEPTTALDPAHEERMMAEIRRSALDGRAVIAVLHDLNAAAGYADRVLVVAEARLQAFGTPAEVLSDDLLTDVYGYPMRVIDHPFREGLLVVKSS